jgi:hypothetical protein
MTAPPIGPAFIPAAPPDFGPDASATPQNAPKINTKTPPRATKDVLGKLGQNKRLRSPVRVLSDEDMDKLGDRYRWLGKIASPFHPKFGAAMQEQADECAKSWTQLAANNDKVRRWILAFIEGGDWGGVIAAHMPIFMAVIPEKTLERILLRGVGMFVSEPDDEEIDYSNWEATA